MQIAIGSDSFGCELKIQISDFLSHKGYQVTDYNAQLAAEAPYYKVAAEVADDVSKGKVNKAILVCGTGMGMAIIANKFPGVYAAVCENMQAAKYSRSINNSNVLTLGKLITPPEIAFQIIDTWLNTEFTAGWDSSIKDFLHNSVAEIQKIEQDARTITRY